jgi:hypothetical protein
MVQNAHFHFRFTVKATYNKLVYAQSIDDIICDVMKHLKFSLGHFVENGKQYTFKTVNYTTDESVNHCWDIWSMN